MAVNKVVYNNRTLMDITDSTVKEETLKVGETAYNSAGVKITGSMASSSDLQNSHTIINDETGVITTMTEEETITVTFSTNDGIDTITEKHVPTSGNQNIIKKTVITPTPTGDDIVTTITKVNK